MMRLLLALMAMAAPSPAADAVLVDIPGRLFDPASVTVVAGRSVTWRNDDSATHDISAQDGSFGSGRLVPGTTFTHAFPRPGRHPYLCRIHRSMRGVVDVVAIDLRPPEAPVLPGRTVHLDALASPDSGPLRLERLEDGGPPQVVAESQPDEAGLASFAFVTAEPGRYRARAGDLTSAVAVVRLLPRVDAVASVRGRRVTVRVQVTPPHAAREVALEHHVRERFDYLPLARRRVDAAGRARFTLRVRRRTRLRAGVAVPALRWASATSAPLVLGR